MYVLFHIQFAAKWGARVNVCAFPHTIRSEVGCMSNYMCFFTYSALRSGVHERLYVPFHIQFAAKRDTQVIICAFPHTVRSEADARMGKMLLSQHSWGFSLVKRSIRIWLSGQP